MSDYSELLAVLAHEMRTPIAAILGYQELISEGIFGKVDEKAQDGLNRIAYSAHQLLHLIDGVQEIGTPGAKRLSSTVEPFEPAAVLRECLENAHADAVGRNVQLESWVPEELPELRGDPERFCRAVDLALAAAIKTSHGATLHVSAGTTADGLHVTIDHTGLSPKKDDPTFVLPNTGKLSGAGLRLAIVSEIARQMHGELRLQPGDQGTVLALHFRSSD